MAKKKETAVAYVVLIGCQNDKTGKTYSPGDVVTTGDFPQAVITAWLKSDPPVLAVKEAADDGSNP